MDQVTLLVSTFDGYSMCWKPFCYGLSKYWPNHPRKLKFITNWKEPEHGAAIKVGKDKGWSENLLAALKEIDTPYLLYAQEDYWIDRLVPDDCINSYLSFLESGQADYIRLYPVPPPDMDFPPDPRLGVMSPGAQYRTSLQMALWRKEILQDLLRPRETAWQFEVKAGDRSKKYGSRFLCVTKRRYGISYTFTAITNGEWSQTARNYARQEGIIVNFHDLPRKRLLKYYKDNIRKMLYKYKRNLLNNIKKTL
jgi:hypothetical protein